MMTLTNVRNDKNIGVCAYSDLSEEMPIVLALGMFDGVHIGHQALLTATAQLAQKYAAAPTMMTFSEHPGMFIPGKSAPMLLTTLREKVMLAADFGITQVLPVSFDEEFCSMSPKAFIENYILSANVRAVVCGYNYRFGKDAVGDGEFLKAYLEKRDIEVCITEKRSVDGVAVSSTLIRKLVSEGDIVAANKYLGYRYRMCSNVVSGFHRGTGLGFPTANMIPSEDKCLPSRGVYATAVFIDGREYASVTNIGMNPTFDNKKITAETNIFDFEGDLYGKYLCVEFKRKIRNEIKFSSPDELKAQVEKDIICAKNNMLA